MWWCCGKPSKDAPGCKFSKHVCKEDEDEDIEQSAQECPRDPNYRTSNDPNEEDMRVVKSKEFRKVKNLNLILTFNSFYLIH